MQSYQIFILGNSHTGNAVCVKLLLNFSLHEWAAHHQFNLE